VGQLDKLHSNEGAARRSVQNPAMIAVGSQRSLAEQLMDNLAAAKREIASLRETSEEW
jgi:hypothetical protein